MERILVPIGDLLILLIAVMISKGTFYCPEILRLELACPTIHFSDFVLLASIYIAVFYKMGLYASYSRWTRLGLFSAIFSACLLSALIYLSLAFLLDLCLLSRVQALLFIFSSTSLLLIYRLSIYYAVLFIRDRRNNYRNILIVGSLTRAREVIEILSANKFADYKIMGCLEVDKERIGATVYGDVKVIGTMDDYHELLLNNVIDEIIFAMPLSLIDNSLDYLSFADDLGINVRVLPNWQLFEMAYHPRNAVMILDTTTDIPSLSLSSTPQKAVQLMLKEATDIAGSLCLLLLLSPLMATIAFLIKITSPGPVFFKQTRLGLNGRKFTIYKFRTMVQNAEAAKEDLQFLNEEDGPAFKIESDPRITKFGKFLRKTSLDELPQLFNVLKGEMSLVGPRPPLPEEVDLYQPWQRRRLAMKPGLTCLWQVYARNRVDFNTWMKLDLMYIDNWSYFLDVKLIIKTIPVIFKLTGR